MAKVCDNKSAGVLVWNNGKLLMIERKKYNPGFAIPAGHLDGGSPESGARRELVEEIGLTAGSLEKKLIFAMPNTCKREGGSFHEWTLFEARDWSGEISASEEEVKGYCWVDRAELLSLKTDLEAFAERKNLSLILENLPLVVQATNEDGEWGKNPGLEPPMYFLFKKLGLI